MECYTLLELKQEKRKVTIQDFEENVYKIEEINDEDLFLAHKNLSENLYVYRIRKFVWESILNDIEKILDIKKYELIDKVSKELDVNSSEVEYAIRALKMKEYIREVGDGMFELLFNAKHYLNMK